VNGIELRRALRTGGPVFGTLVVSPSPRLPTALTGAGLDFIFIDTEHIALDRAQLSWMCQVYRQMGMAPLVRIPEPSPTLAAMALDGGAVGIVAPYIEKPEQVTALAGAVKWRPLKGQRLERLLNGEEIEPQLRRYLEQHNAHNILVVNIESAPAVENLDAILDVAGLDAVLIGPHDLSCSLGFPEQYDHPQFDKAVRNIISSARARRVGAGIHFWGDLQQEVRWLKDGLNMLIHSGDITLFVEHLTRDLQTLKHQAGITQPSTVPRPHIDGRVTV